MKEFLGAQLLKALSAADDRTLARALRANLGDLRLSLCFHRVAGERSKVAMPAEEIDRLIGFVFQTIGPLTVSFDDGHGDGAEYVLSRAARFPQIEWLYFLCPRKTEEGAEADLAPIGQCREIQRLPNAALGNHTNSHRRLSLLSPREVREELQASQRDFERLFGRQSHFALPFGVPGIDFSPETVEELRALGDSVIWSTEPRPFHARERRPGAVLPRFAVDGRRTWKETAVHIALHALRTRVFAEARA
jgi:hypothetical protein